MTRPPLSPGVWLLALALGALPLGCARGGSVTIATPPGDDDGSGDPGMPIDPATGPTSFVRLAGLTAAAAGLGTVRVHFTAPDADEELALFVSDDAGTVYAGAPVEAPLTGTSTTVGGLPDGMARFFGLGVRAAGSGDPYLPVGVVLTATPGPVIYVDPTADPTVADGMTPATAFPNPVSAFLTAFVAGGGNLWLAEGDYAVAFIPQFAGVHAYGGFQPDFDLATRDPEAGNTRFNAVPRAA